MRFANKISTIVKSIIGLSVIIAVVAFSPQSLTSFHASACTWVTTSCGSGCSDNKDLYNCASKVAITSVTPSSTNPDANAKTALVAPPTVTQYVPTTTVTPVPAAAAYITGTPGQTVGSTVQTIDQTGRGGAVQTATGMVNTTAGTSSTGTVYSGDNCNPGSGSGSSRIYPDIRCGSPYCGASYMGQECGYDGKWSTTNGDCVHAHACGYVSAGGECGYITASDPTIFTSCQSLGYGADVTCTGYQTGGTARCTTGTATTGYVYFAGCGSAAGLGTGDKCWNCYSNGQCYNEPSSCGANVNCRTSAPAVPVATAPPKTIQTTPAPAVYACVSITKDIATPKYGDSVTFTCGTMTSATHYEFQYQVGTVSGTLAPLNATSNISKPLPVSHLGAYKAQCRPCTDSICAPWVEIWTLTTCNMTTNPAKTCPAGFTCRTSGTTLGADGTCN